MKKKLHIYLTLIFLITLSSTVFASHFRSGVITWREVSPLVVEFTVTTSWRSGSADNVYLNYGSTVTDVQETSNLIVSDVNGVATRVQKIIVTYPAEGPFNVSWGSCCRIGGLSSAGSTGNFVLSTIVDLTGGNENSPVVSLPATVNVPVGSSAATFQVPANDLDGDALSYRLATVAELNGNQPAGFSIDAVTGLATVNTTLSNYVAGQLYIAGIVVSDGKTSVYADFLIQITQPSTPPEFLYGPTPVNASVIVVSPGQNVNFQVSARDVDAGGNVSSLFATGIPGGATFTTASGNPATSTFNWTPTASNFGGYVINFVAQDNVGVQVFSSVTIQVSLKPQFDVPPTPAAGVHNVYSPGQIISFPVQVSDPDTADVVRIVDVKGKDMMGQEIPLYSNASLSVLPSLAANPTSATFSWATQAADWGHKHIYFWAEDGYGDRTRHEVNVLINSNPSLTSIPPSAIVKVAGTYNYDVIANDVDVAYGDILDLYAIGAPAWLTFTDNGDGTAKLSGTPTLTDVGTFNFRVEAHDINHHDNIGGIPFQNISITVSSNIVPTISAISNQSTCPNTSISNIPFAIDDAETATGSLTISATSSNPGLLPVVNIVFGGSDALRTVSLTPALGQSGTSNVVVTVDDGQGGTEISTFIFTVEDKVVPVVVTKNITVQLDATGNATIAPADVNDGSTDACGIDLLELDNDSFTCANVGVNTVTLKVTDKNGNAATQTAIVTVEDKIAPVVVTKNITVQLNAMGTALIGAADVNNGSTDACGIDLLELDNDSFTCANVGINTVTLKVTDKNGNVATQTAIVTVEDKIAPVVVTKNITVQLDALGNATIAPVDVNDGSTDTCGIDLLELDNDSFTCANVGVNTVTLKVTDKNGNVATQTAIVTIEDKIASVVVTKNITVQLDALGNATIAPAEVDNGSIDACGIDLLELDITSFTCANIGLNTVTLKVTDVNGNVTSKTAVITVEDKIAPVVVTKNTTIQLNAAGTASIVVADVNNGSTDNCGISLVELDKMAFTCANVGANTVTLKVTDNNGNIATQTAIITVEDKIAPVVVTKNTTIQLNAAGTASIVVADVNNGSTDNCGISLVELDKMAFTCANVGANTVTLKVTDNNGNIATQTAIIIVEDKTAPVVVTKNTTIQLNATGTASVVAADINNGSTDACGISLLELDKSTFTCANIGLNTVTLKVTDVNGNVTSKTAVVAVEDKMAPVVVAKNKTIQLNAAGTASIVVADVNNGSTDNCGISLVELDKMAFTCANVGANTVTLKVTDNNGNVATQTAVITVEDKIAPMVITKNITVQLDASSNILIAAADVNNGSTDNCGISLLELNKALFSCANVGENVVTLKVTDNSGNVTTRTAIVTIVNSQPNLIRKHFDDVIFFDNSSKAFVAYSWYKNGVLVSSQTAQYFKDSGVLNGTYYAKATKIDGTVVTTCPLTFSASIVDEYLKIAPNPVKSNASYQILTNVDSVKLQNARITVFNILGVLVNDKIVDGITTDMIAPNTEGIYVVRMTLTNGKYFTKNLLVKN
ncbi:T9SS type A sorting domain-containing protein [Flavobacterium sp. Sr18]|uniref:putative Ig domain-containing protein n=1 Tax=Flavobacterium sp. Sr18 TaxID=935222 RepID=UPI0013E439EF|nr:putative Ig domain-containing protein [Flavobacterium sp. Sr18]QIH39419.1 T9SS type A sorting domain-containing protein [Flavobacterium sp. Sr18]